MQTYGSFHSRNICTIGASRRHRKKARKSRKENSPKTIVKKFEEGFGIMNLNEKLRSAFVEAYAQEYDEIAESNETSDTLTEDDIK